MAIRSTNLIHKYVLSRGKQSRRIDKYILLFIKSFIKNQ